MTQYTLKETSKIYKNIVHTVVKLIEDLVRYNDLFTNNSGSGAVKISGELPICSLSHSLALQASSRAVTPSTC